MILDWDPICFWKTITVLPTWNLNLIKGNSRKMLTKDLMMTILAKLRPKEKLTDIEEEILREIWPKLTRSPRDMLKMSRKATMMLSTKTSSKSSNPLKGNCKWKISKK